MGCGFILVWIIGTASASQTSHTKVTVFSLQCTSKSAEDSRAITRCLELGACKICSSVVCKFGNCHLYQETSTFGSKQNTGLYKKDQKVVHGFYNGYQKVLLCVLRTVPRKGGLIVVKGQEPKKRKRKKKLLLIFPIHYESKLSIQKVEIGKWSPTYYPLYVKNINAIVYVPWKRQLLVASSTRNVARVYPMFKRRPKTFIRGVLILRFAIDEGRQLVFVATSKPNKTISRVTNDGSGVESVFRKKRVTMLDICADPEQSRLYILVRGTKKHRVVSIGYGGENETHHVTSSKQIIFSFDKEKKILYYSSGKWLRKLSIENNSRAKVKKFTSRLVVLFHYLGNVYIRLNAPWTLRYETNTGKSAFIQNKYSFITPKILNFCVVS